MARQLPTRQEVAGFLTDFKHAAAIGWVQWLPRRYDRPHLAGLEIMKSEAIELIKQLTPGNYSSGPEPDHVNPSRRVWVFGRHGAGTEADIKLALQPDKTKRHIVYGLIWSFHGAD